MAKLSTSIPLAATSVATKIFNLPSLKSFNTFNLRLCGKSPIINPAFKSFNSRRFATTSQLLFVLQKTIKLEGFSFFITPIKSFIFSSLET